MDIQEQIDRYIADQPQPKREDIEELHRNIVGVSPSCKLSFSDGRNSENKIVSNPCIGYGEQTIKYANGKTRDAFQIGISGNTAGISVYIMGVEGRTYLSKTYGSTLGKAKITGYCITFKTVKDINVDVLAEIIADHLGGRLAGGS